MVDRTRHAAIFDASRTGITLIGLGGIGAITAVTLAKMGVLHLTGIDDDEVSEENVATQLYQSSDIGISKTASIYDAIGFYAPDVDFVGRYARVGWDAAGKWADIANEIIISGVDSIESRQDIWAAIWDEPWLWYIDARMGAESLLIYTVNGKDRQWYNDMIGSQDDSQVPNDPCTSKATFYCGAAAAAFIGSTVRKIITGRTPPTVLSLNLVENVLITNGS
jgi:molybdopterin/thiamine biosynthesis adenylyltransferase